MNIRALVYASKIVVFICATKMRQKLGKIKNVQEEIVINYFLHVYRLLFKKVKTFEN
jgi:hypothetical protein